ncbi:MAG: DUF1592 domain-containing protein [Acidobacteria bacterium]|nr:DUF1592 domain-containing protein [Acidobacteriota bacterium]
MARTHSRSPLANWLAALAIAGAAAGPAAAEPPAASSFVSQYCVACHSDQAKTGGLTLEPYLDEPVSEHSATWEKVVRRLRARQMPPAGMPRPDEQDYQVILASLESELDHAAVAAPNPGRTDTFRRLTRTEYRNAVRDLLDLDVDVSALLPNDESSHGFDNITVGDLSPTLLDRYISAAQKVSRLAVGRPGRSPGGDTILVPPDLTQEQHINGLPIGTRGGTVVAYTFPADAEYEIQIRLARDRNEQMEGLTKPHEVELLLDRQRIRLFTVKPPRTLTGHATADLHLRARIPITAGPHEVAVDFPKQPTTLLETERQPYQAHFNYYRHPRIQPAVYSVSILGPYDVAGPGDTPSRQRLFLCEPAEKAEQDACAQRILGKLMRRAYRRPVSSDDLERPLALYRDIAEEEGFEAGVEMALSALLVSPEFLFRVERDPAGMKPGEAYPVSDLELASRLSFFLWSSIPDEPLLKDAEAGRLHDPDVFEGHVRRMLADERSSSLVTNFAAQWLYLRNLDSITPDMRRFPDFDDNLRQAFRQETELFFAGVLREDRSVLDLLDADYTYLNERLAKHYGIPNIYGSRFRRVDLAADSHRGGLLRQGSVLTVTSYATRTSPVIRGKWILDNLLGIPPPPPPPDVPALEEDGLAIRGLSVRQRLAEHRKNPACAGCHNLMDPVGFALETYDAVGRWRTSEEGKPIDASGGLPDGSRFEGVDGMVQALQARPEMFVGTLTEKLLTYALGRGMETYDAPAVREIVRAAGEDDYRFSGMIVGIAQSAPFQMRRSR